MTFILQELFCRNFRKGRLLTQTVRAHIIDMKKKIPKIGIINKLCNEHQGHFNQYGRIPAEPKK